ncbi:PREDICTED: F-box protein SKIP31 isoform X2 [Lupinus angustifolius]|uniref:F-box protein SKIP31 isoform X2 n=1 Tax=Lupinus angustifolius TaxID=3871 RepID=UPI00092F2938|nr:PREDICTED: F-box protein SKIP31 isoform X2 [Lupinus angustifolius]
MSLSDDEDENLAHFLESEVLSEASDLEVDNVEEPKAKRKKVDEAESSKEGAKKSTRSSSELKNYGVNNGTVSTRIDTGFFSNIPPELFHRILKFLSSEDLVSCSLVCKFLNYAASDESLWRRLYCMRWGLLPPTRKLRECPWKMLYIQRDGEDMGELVRNCQNEFKQYYIQMQAAKRSQAPHPSLLNDDRILLDKTLADQVASWKSSKGLSDTVVTDHACSGETCSYYQIGDVFICEKTGQVHVCDDTCREVIMDPTNELLVCTISGHCFDRLLSAAEMEPDADQEQQQGGVTDEAEPFMGSGRFARAYLLGYNCADEKELEATLRFC